MEWICDSCKKKRTLCHLSCSDFKRETLKSAARKRTIELAMKREREMNNFAFDVHRNGLRYERTRRKSPK